jgi:SAM-dependent methyltransferase
MTSVRPRRGCGHVDRWHKAYSAGRRWGDQPGELARLAVGWLPESGADGSWRLLDVGCGYGRDAVFLARELGVRVVGIDPAAAGIELALASAPAGLSATSGSGGPALGFRCCGIEAVDDGPYDVVFVSNVYHVLPPEGRAALRERVHTLLRPGGFLLLSTLAVGDPTHCGLGCPVPGDPEPFVEDAALYFSTEESLRAEFAAFDVLRLLRHDFIELQSDGPNHHHVHLVLMARRPGCPARG